MINALRRALIHEQNLRRALIHEQNLNEQLRERIMELETEVKTLTLKLRAKFAGEVDDN